MGRKENDCLTQIKIFSRVNINDRISDLEEDINKWLNCNEDEVEVLEIKWHFENTRVVMIVYKLV